MARILAWAFAASLLVLHLEADAKGGRGGGHCSTGHASAAGHSRGGSAMTLRSASASRTTTSYGAGRVLEDGTYLEPGRDCAPDRPCDPNATHLRPAK